MAIIRPLLGLRSFATKAATSATAGRKHSTKFTTTGAITVDGMAVLPATTSATAKIKCAIYADNAGVPGALIATTQEGTGVTANQVKDLTFAAPVNLSATTTYWLAVLSDTALAYYYDNNGAAGYYYAADTYSTGPANPFGAGTASTGALAIAAGTVLDGVAASKSSMYAVTGAAVGVNVAKAAVYAVLSVETKIAVSKALAYAVIVDSPAGPVTVARPQVACIT